MTGWLIVLASVVAYLPGLVAGPSFDAAVFGTVGWLGTEGLVPYRDVWDHKPPLIYLINWGLQLLPGGLHWWHSVVLASIAATVATGLLLVWVLLRHVTTRKGAAVTAVAACLAMGQYPLSLGGGLTETFGTPLLVAALFVATRNAVGARALVLCGVLLAAALAVSLPTAPGAAAISVLVVGTHGWPSLLAVAGGGTAALLLIAGVVSALGAGPMAWDALIRYSSAYGASSELQSASLATATLALAFLIIPALLGIVRFRRDWEGHSPLLVAMVAWVIISVVGFILVGRFEIHYAIPLVIPLAFMAALTSRPPPGRVDRISVPILVATGLALSTAVSLSASLPLVDAYAAENRRVATVAEVVRDASADGEQIAVWGLETLVYLESNRMPAGRHIYLYPLTTPGYSDRAQVEAERQAWERSEPALIVDAGSLFPGSPGAPPLLLPRPVAFDGRDLDLLDPLRSYMRPRYRLLDIVDGWPVYIRAAS